MTSNRSDNLQHADGHPASSSREAPAKAALRSYRKPRLTEYGKLVDITLGGTPGAGDTGPGEFVENPLG